jgi:hypothetical protein
VNKKIDRALVDLDRHFDLVQANNGFATPAAIKKSYTAPAPDQDRPSGNAQKVQNLAFNRSLDKLIDRFLDYSKRQGKANNLKGGPTPERAELLRMEKEEIREKIKAQVEAGDLIFKNRAHEKTFVLILNEYLLRFLQEAFNASRAYTTLEKNMCRNRRYIQFFNIRSRPTTSRWPLSSQRSPGILRSCISGVPCELSFWERLGL